MELLPACRLLPLVEWTWMLLSLDSALDLAAEAGLVQAETEGAPKYPCASRVAVISITAGFSLHAVL